MDIKGQTSLSFSELVKREQILMIIKTPDRVFQLFSL